MTVLKYILMYCDVLLKTMKRNESIVVIFCLSHEHCYVLSCEILAITLMENANHAIDIFGSNVELPGNLKLQALSVHL
jgi:hypothetical protein